MLLGYYNNRDHNFELTMLSLVIFYIPFLCLKMFSILKDEKRVFPTIIIKGPKGRKIKKDIKYEPHKKKQIEILKVFHVQMRLIFVYFSSANKIVCILSKMPQFMMII